MNFTKDEILLIYNLLNQLQFKRNQVDQIKLVNSICEKLETEINKDVVEVKK